jgi:hypothetical protein
MSLSITPQILALPPKARFEALPKLAADCKLVQVLTGSVDAIFHHPEEGLIELVQGSSFPNYAWKDLVFHQQGPKNSQENITAPKICVFDATTASNTAFGLDASNAATYWQQALRILEQKGQAIEPQFHLLA